MRDTAAAGKKKHRRRLSDWLAEWNLEQALARADTEAPDGSKPIPEDALNTEPDGPPLEPGQVRLFFPDSEMTASRPMYGLFLADVSSGEWGVVPFGRFAVPAVPGEWRTGLRALPLRVLCPWNTRRVAVDRSLRSWRALRLDPERCATAYRLTLDCHVRPDGRLPPFPGSERNGPALFRSMGPPLVHPLDPRRRYLSKESERWDALGPPWGRRRPDIIERGVPWPSATGVSFPYDRCSTTPIRKAAERKTRYPEQPDDGV